MSAQGLGSRAIIGAYYARLEQATGQNWIDAVANMFNSDQESETYKWLGQSPQMREWIGGRNAKGFTENGFTIKNLHFEATLEILVREMRRDKTGQIMVRVNELADRTNSHWAKLLSTLIENGESSLCYDGQFFFDTDHEEGTSGVQSNDINVDISALPVTNHGSVTAPSAAEMQGAILAAIQQMYGFKDDVGEPINETANAFLVMVPTSLLNVAIAATTTATLDSGDTNIITNGSMNISVVSNARLTWTDQFVVARTDGNVKPFIRQQETDVKLAVKAEGSEFEFDNDAHQYGVDAWRNVGYGMWQGTCLVTMIQLTLNKPKTPPL